MANTPPKDNNEASPLSPGTIIPATQNLAVNLIRAKLNSLYAEEPDAESEEAEVMIAKHRSKHQQYMFELTTSGKDLVQIQTEWHNYYQRLSNEDKKKVWQEFYDSNKNAAIYQQRSLDMASTNKEQPLPSATQARKLATHIQERAVGRAKRQTRTAANLRQSVRSKANTKPKLTWKHHLQSALFGLGMGAIVVFILLFGFFNQVLIAPFIQPSRTDTATPIILSTSTVAPSATPEVIIPKINVEIPVDYSVTSTNENVIENDLEAGVVHYPTTSFPGQTGNAAFFGHSSNNILNPGKYKFAFVLLHDLVDGDVFYLTYNGKIYAYKVFSTAIVNPNDVGVLNSTVGHSATATLITCDPPGTSINRLVVVGDQISPDPNTNTAPTAPIISTASQISQLPGNGPSLWHRFITPIWGKAITAIFILGVGLIAWRWYQKEFKNS